MNHDSLTIGVRHEPRYAIVTGNGNTSPSRSSWLSTSSLWRPSVSTAL